MCETEELQQDDEVVLGMVEKNEFPGVLQLAGPTPFYAALSNKKLAVIAFYLSCEYIYPSFSLHLCSYGHRTGTYNMHFPLPAWKLRIDCVIRDMVSPSDNLKHG